MAAILAAGVELDHRPPPEVALDTPRVDDLLAERDIQIAELRQAVADIERRQDEARYDLHQQELATIREQIARLEARTFEQERTIRQTLSMLIEWIEGDMKSSKAA